MKRSLWAVAALMLVSASPAAGQIARIGVVGSRWRFDHGTASQAPTIRHGVALSLGFEQVRRMSPQFSATFIPEGHIDPGLVGAAAELRLLLLGSESGLASVLTLGGGLAALLAGNRSEVVEGCRPPCMFEGENYSTGVNFMSTAGLGLLVPTAGGWSLAPSASYVILMGEQLRVLTRVGVGLLWRR